MAVGFKVGYYWFQVGTSDFLHSFFFNDMYSARTWKMGKCLSQINGRIISRMFKKSGFKRRTRGIA